MTADYPLYPPNFICYIGLMAYEVRYDHYGDWVIFATLGTRVEAEAFRKEFLRRYKLYLEASGAHRYYGEEDIKVVERPVATLDEAIKAIRAVSDGAGYVSFVIDLAGEYAHIPDFMTFD